MNNANVTPSLSKVRIPNTTADPFQIVTPVILETTEIICKTAVNSFTFQVTIVVALIVLCAQCVIAFSIEKFGPKYVLSE